MKWFLLKLQPIRNCRASFPFSYFLGKPICVALWWYSYYWHYFSACMAVGFCHKALVSLLTLELAKSPVCLWDHDYNGGGAFPVVSGGGMRKFMIQEHFGFCWLISITTKIRKWWLMTTLRSKQLAEFYLKSKHKLQPLLLFILFQFFGGQIDG